MIEFLFSIIVFVGLTFFLATPIRHPYTKALVSLVVSTVLCLLALIDVRLIFVAVIVMVTYIYVSPNKMSVIVAVPAAILAVALAVMPNADDLLYLQMRYPDTFTRLTDDMYYSRTLDTNIKVSRLYGDDYQSKLYESLITQYTINALPKDTEVLSCTISTVTTTRLFSGYRDYIEAVRPTVRLRVKLPENAKLDGCEFPFNTTVEVIT